MIIIINCLGINSEVISREQYNMLLRIIVKKQQTAIRSIKF